MLKHTKSTVHIFISFILMLLINGCSTNTANQIESVAETGKNKYTYTYKDAEYDFNLYLPENSDTKNPLIVMLHGYNNNADSFRTQTHMDDAACKRGYAVVYMTAKSDGSNSTSSLGWNSGLDDSQKDDVGQIKALTNYLCSEYNCDKKRVFAVGFSNGAFMTQRLAMEASDTFKAVASVAGMMPEKIWNERTDSKNIGVFQIYGTKDDVVPMKLNGSDKTSVAPAIEDVMAYWADANKLTEKSEDQLSKKSALTKYYSSNKPNQVWTIIIDDGRHSWPDEKIAGFSANDLILDFFDLY